MHVANSGYGVASFIFPNILNPNLLNAWDFTPNRFDNEYYKSVANVLWFSDPQYIFNQFSGYPIGDKNKTFWIGANNSNIILHPDMALAFDISMVDNGLTIPPNVLNVFLGGQVCGAVNDTLVKLNESIYIKNPPPIGDLPAGPFKIYSDDVKDRRACVSTGNKHGSTAKKIISYEAKTYPQVVKYINSNKLFLLDFQKAFSKLITLGYGSHCKLGSSLKTIPHCDE